MISIGQKIRIIRQKKGLTQQNIADDLNISLTGYAKIERGETDIPYSRLCQIAKYHKISVSKLISIDSNSSDEYNIGDKLDLILNKIVVLEKKLDLIGGKVKKH